MKSFSMAMLASPRAALFLIFGLGGAVSTVINYWTQSKTECESTISTLVDVRLFERTRNNKSEKFAELVYEYRVNHQDYDFIKEVDLEMEIEKSKTDLMNSEHQQIKVYYNLHNPSESTSNLSETKPDDQLIYVLFPSLLILASLGLWGLKISYKLFINSEE